MKNSTNLHIFAKSILALVCLIAAQTVGAAAPTYEMNIYASRLDIKTNMSNNTREVTLRFFLSSPGKGVTIYIDRDNNGFEDSDIVYNDDDLIMKRDAFTEITFTVDDNFPGGKHNWAVKVKGAPAGTNYGGTVNDGKSYGFNTSTQPGLVRDYQNADHRYMFQYPKALAINTYCDSKYCGYSYVGEAGSLSGLVKTDKTPRRMGSTQGIYVFGPNMSTRWSSTDNILQAAQNYGAFSGGGAISWWLHNDYGYFGPCHLSVDKDGYVYVCQNHPTSKKIDEKTSEEIPNRIWRVPASRLEKGNGNVAFDSIMTTSMLNQAGVPKRVLAMSVGNINNDKILYVISGTTSSSLIQKASLSSWKITEKGNDVCSLTFIKSIQLTDISYNKPQKLKSPHCSVVPGNDNGDLWIFQKVVKGEEKDSLFAAIHFSPSQNGWTADYRIPSTEHTNISGKGTVGKHYTYTTDGLYYLAMPSTKENKDCIKVFRMYKDDSNGWHRDHTYSINNPEDANAGFDKADAVAIDLANNIYFTSSKTGRLYVYALPKENEHTTSASTTEQLNIPYKVTWNRNDITEDYTSAPTYNYMYSSDFMPILGKEGYKFHGWYEDPNFSGTPVTSITKNTALYARWTRIEFYEDNATQNTTVLEDDVNGYHGSVWVYRKLQGGMYSSLCLPFDVTTDILNKATNSAKTSNPLSGATLWTFSSVSTEGDGTKILHFKPTDKVTANTPFLIEPTDDIAEEIFFHGVTISKPTNYQAAGTITHNGITFTGVINPVELAAGSNTFFLVSDNRLAIPAAGGVTLGGLRGYFTNPSGSKLAIRTQQNTPTLLESVNCNIKNTYKILQDGKIYIIRDGVMYDIKGYRL